jgi:hypothetical protein
LAIQLSGPFAFNPQTIDALVAKTSPGVYLLGYTSGSRFYVERVGRSDVNLNARLKSPEYAGKFQQFKALYYETADAAYHAECELYHAYGGYNNPNHPARPAEKNHKCNHCNLF